MDAFVGEIRLMALGFVPQNWVLCDGTRYPVQSYQALYAVIGNIYGGTPGTNFNVPDLRARVAVAVGDDPLDVFDPTLGATGGANSVTLSLNQIPAHTHALTAVVTPVVDRTAAAQGNWLGQPANIPSGGGKNELANGFAAPSGLTLVALNNGSLSPYPGAGGAHENRQPYLALQYLICVDGVFPIRP